MQSISQSKFHVLRFEQPSFSFTTCHHHHYRVSVLNPILGRSSRKPPDPPLHAYDPINELSAESFMTKMTPSISQSKFHVLRFEPPSFSFTTCHHHHYRVSVLNPILGRSSRNPPDPPLHAYMDTLAEWSRRRPAKPMGSPRVGSNFTGVDFKIKSASIVCSCTT